MSGLLTGVVGLPKNALIGLVKAYRLLLSPWLGSICRFEPTCSIYSLQALHQHGAARGSYLTLRRLVRCQPWCPGGLDPVPSPAPGSFFNRLFTPADPISSKKTPS